MSKLYVDPPSGWQYNFPKIWDSEKYPDMRKWLVDNGYSQSMIDKMGERFYCRFWQPDDEELAKYENSESTNATGEV
jgi:hypothetical protein